MPRKPRPDSNLKTLPSDQQAEIITRLKAKGGSYKAVVQWLRDEWDVDTSEGALSSFWSWWHLQEQVREAESDTQSLVEALRGADISMTAEQVREFGNLAFITKATKQQDSKTFVAMARILVQNRKLDQDSRRIAILEKKAAAADEASEIAKDGSKSKAERQKQLFELFGK